MLHVKPGFRSQFRFVTCRPNLLFWTNWNTDDPSILRSHADGDNITKIISTGIKTPNGLTIDKITKHLYWADADLDKIERCDFDGKNRKVKLCELFSCYLLIKIHRLLAEW